jgi:hypothetical protein
MTLHDLKPGTRFIKWDGVECVLVETTDGRARIRVENRPKVKKIINAHDDEGAERRVEFETAGKTEYDVALGTEVLEVL